jgi:hypothetical protein
MNNTIHKYSPPVIASSIPAREQHPYGPSPYADERADMSMSSSLLPYTPSELKQSDACQETLKQSGYHDRTQLFGRISSIDVLLSSVNVSRDGSLTRTRTNTKQSVRHTPGQRFQYHIGRSFGSGFHKRSSPAARNG